VVVQPCFQAVVLAFALCYVVGHFVEGDYGDVCGLYHAMGRAVPVGYYAIVANLWLLAAFGLVGAKAAGGGSFLAG